jgi:hypothetical protein
MIIINSNLFRLNMKSVNLVRRMTPKRLFSTNKLLINGVKYNIVAKPTVSDETEWIMEKPIQDLTGLEIIGITTLVTTSGVGLSTIISILIDSII